MARPFYQKLYLRALRTARKCGLRKRQNQQSVRSARSLGPRIVVIGGGTGLSTMLRGLKTYTENITAIVSVSDDAAAAGRYSQLHHGACQYRADHDGADELSLSGGNQ